MDLKQIMGHVIDTLYQGLTGGSAELPLPTNVNLNWLMPGLPFHESAFDFALAGPYAGPTPLTLDYFKELVAANMGEGVDRAQAIESAKLMYQQNLLGTWEQWSRLVDFIPYPVPTTATSTWTSRPGSGKYKHVSVVYGQSNRTLSQVYKDTLDRCEVADDELSAEQKKIVDQMRALLEENVEVEDFLTGEKKIEPRESRAMIMYKEKRSAYENAVVDYASRLASANSGSAADLIEWQRSGGIYRRRATEALNDWVARGYKNDVERAQATLSHILGSSMVVWKQKLSDIISDIENNTTGMYGYAFHPAGVLPGGFARSQGWSTFAESKLESRSSSSSSSSSWGARAGLNLGLFSIGGSGGGSTSEYTSEFRQETFEMSFQYTSVEIMRPAFNPSFFLSRGWRPKQDFITDYGTTQHSDGKNPPSGALIGYPTKALFVRDLRIKSDELATFLHSKQSTLNAGGTIGYGPFVLGGNYQQSNKEQESNLDINGASIHVKGLQLVCFMSALFPFTANPSPDVKKWI